MRKESNLFQKNKGIIIKAVLDSKGKSYAATRDFKPSPFVNCQLLGLIQEIKLKKQKKVHKLEGILMVKLSGLRRRLHLGFCEVETAL